MISYALHEWLRQDAEYLAADTRVVELVATKSRLETELAAVRSKLRDAGAIEELQGDIERVRCELERARDRAGKNSFRANEYVSAIKSYNDRRTPRVLSSAGKDKYTAEPMVATHVEPPSMYVENARMWRQRADRLADELEQLERQVTRETTPTMSAVVLERLGIEPRISKIAELRSQRQQIESDIDEITELIKGAEVLRDELTPAAAARVVPLIRKRAAELRRQWREACDKIRNDEDAFEAKMQPRRAERDQLGHHLTDVERLLHESQRI